MPKMVVKATELKDTDVQFVSLVKRGANRIPFRFTKSEDEPMLDLHKIGRSLFRKGDGKPAVAAVLARKSADQDAIKARLTKAGLAVDNASEKEGTVVYAQKGVDQEGAVVVKLDDNVALVVTNVQKAFESYDFSSTTFGEVFKAGSFYPSMCVANDMLASTVSNIMYDAADPASAAEAISKAVDEYKDYVTALASSLPVQAFKADVEVKKAAKDMAAAEDAADGGADDADENPDGSKKTKAKKGETVDPTANTDKGKGPDNADAAALAANGIKKDGNIEANPVEGTTTSDTRPPNTQGTSNDVEGSPVAGNQTPSASGGKLNVGEKPASNDVEGSPVAGSTTSAAMPGDLTKGDGKDPFAELKKMLTDGFAVIEQKVTTQVSTIKTELKGEIDAVSAKVAKAEEALNGTILADAPGDRTGRIEKSEGSGAPPLLDSAYMKVA